jgi:hypothetical protein
VREKFPDFLIGYPANDVATSCLSRAISLRSFLANARRLVKGLAVHQPEWDPQVAHNSGGTSTTAINLVAEQQWASFSRLAFRAWKTKLRFEERD